MESMMAEGIAAVGLAIDRRVPRGTIPRGEAGVVHRGGGRYMSIIGRNVLFHNPADRGPAAVDPNVIARSPLFSPPSPKRSPAPEARRLHFGIRGSGCGARFPARPLVKRARSLVHETSPPVGNSLEVERSIAYRCLMAVRSSTAKELRVSRSEGLRTLVLVIAIASVPIVGTVLAIVSTTEPDLSDLTPIRQPQGQYVLLDWLALRHGDFSPASSVQALGYIVEGNRPLHTGDWVRDFVLLPEAGNILHPAHRIPEQMIAVRLREGEQIQLSPRSLVWVWGTFRASRGDPAGLQPFYLIDQARARRADKSEIFTYFR